MVDGLTLGHKKEDSLLILRNQAIPVPSAHTLGGRVHKENAMVEVHPLEHDDASRDHDPKEQIQWELNHRMHEVVFDQIAANPPLGSTTVQDTREPDDRGRPILNQPVQHVHGGGQVNLRFEGQDVRRREVWIISESNVIFVHSFHRIRKVQDDRIGRLIALVGKLHQCVPQRDAGIQEVDVVQKHVDTAQVVCHQVNLLAEILVIAQRPEKFCELQE